MDTRPYSKEELTNSVIETLLSVPKKLKGRASKLKQDARGTLRFDCRLQCVENNAPHLFKLFIRQSAKLEDSFSIGLEYHCTPCGIDDYLTLMRVNGSTHQHTNKVINNQTFKTFHVHQATSEAIALNLQPEQFASPCSHYRDFRTALSYAWELWHISNPVESIIRFEDDNQLERGNIIQLPLPWGDDPC
jgi:hypothetical protein